MTQEASPTLSTDWSDDQWKSHFESLADQAYRGCGQSDVLFTKRFSNSVDRSLSSIPETRRQELLKLAIDFGYFTEDERNEDLGPNTCRHGLDPDCCPAGCGDIED